MMPVGPGAFCLNLERVCDFADGDWWKIRVVKSCAVSGIELRYFVNVFCHVYFDVVVFVVVCEDAFPVFAE